MVSRKMTIDDMDPDLQSGLKKIPNMRLDRAWVRWLVQTMPVRRERDPKVAQSRQKLTHADIEIYRPKENASGAGLLWIHGGGMIIGKAIMNDPQANHYARDLGLTVVSIDYRLAPKHAYPAAIDDCYEAWLWFLSQADELGVDPSRIAIGGQSAGGGLAAALCQRILDSGGTQPAAQLLIYPMLDDRTTQDDELTDMQHLIWNNHLNMFGWSAYLGHPAGSTDTPPPWAVPGRREDFSGLPPAWIGVGDKDLFLNENEAYASALNAANVSCEYYVAKDSPHAFEIAAPDADVSKRFLDSADAFLRSKLQLN